VGQRAAVATSVAVVAARVVVGAARVAAGITGLLENRNFESFVFQFAIKKLKIKIYRTIILPVVLYGCETWSLTLREKRRLRVFDNWVLRRIFGSKRDEVTGEWRKLHNIDLAILCWSPTIVRVIKLKRMRWAAYVARIW
jgi:hypothetical protein